MTKRERVIKTLNFESPGRVPRDLWALPAVSLFRKNECEEVLSKFPMDISRPELSPGSNSNKQNESLQIGSYVDDWGSVWYRGEPGVIGEVKEPVLKDWNALDNFSPPWHTIEKTKDQDHINRDCDDNDSFMLSEVCARPFERLQFLRGTENVFMDLAYGTKEIDVVLDMLHDFNLKHVEYWCKTNVDGVFIMDDWGTNSSLLISPKLFCEKFKPLYQDYCELIHSYDKYVFFHGDGNIEQIFGDLVEVGVDAINSQLFVMDIEGLAEKYKGKVTFWGEMDRQHVLPFGNPENVRDAVMRVRNNLDDGKGGVIAQCEWGTNDPVENIEALFNAWK